MMQATHAFFAGLRAGPQIVSSSSDFRSGFLLNLVAGVLIVGGLGGCSTATSKIEAKNKIGVPSSRVYYAKYDEVEAALKQTMVKYPQRVDNSDAGIFETDYLKGDARFKPAHDDTVEFSNGYRYRILIRVIKGRSEVKPAVKVQVLKQAEMVHDFFSQAEPRPSDGLEEDAILYRIGRELTIARVIGHLSDSQAKPAQ